MNSTPAPKLPSEELDANGTRYLKREYWCFISYRHADNKEPGRQWATWLHQALETYEVPTDLVGKKNEHGDVIPERIFPVFRDEEELPADAELSKPIEGALKRSRFMVVLCSPQAVGSHYVASEILRFKQLGKKDRILAAIIDGEPNVSDRGTEWPEADVKRECFPMPLRFELDDGGALNEVRTEPIAADFRLTDGSTGWTTPVAYREALKAVHSPEKQTAVLVTAYTKQQNLMLLKIIAGILGVPLGVLTKRDVAYQLEKQQQRAKVLRRWLVLVVILSLVAAVSAVVAGVQKKQANAQTARAEKLLWTASGGDCEAALRSFETEYDSEGLAYLERALSYRPMNTAALAASSAHAFGAQCQAWHTRSVASFDGGVNHLAFSHDGRHLAVGSKDSTARVIETATGREICKVGFGGEVWEVSFSVDGRCFAAGSRDKTLRVIETATGKEISRVMFDGAVKAVSFSPDGRCVAAGSRDKSLRVIEAFTGRMVTKVMFKAVVGTVAFSPDGRCLAVGSEDGTARVIEAATGKAISRVQLRGAVASVIFSPDGRYLAAGSEGQTMRVIEAATGKVISAVEFSGAVTSVRFTPDGRCVAASSEDQTAQVIEAATGKEVSKVEFDDLVWEVSCSPDGRYLAAGSWDHTLRVFEAATGKVISMMKFGGRVWSVTFSPDGRYLAAGSEDGTARLFEAGTGQEINRMEFGNVATSVSFSPDGHHLAVGSRDQTLRVVETASGREIGIVKSGGTVGTVVFSPDGRYIAAGSADITARVLEATSGKEISKVEFGGKALSFSPDGRYLAAGGVDKTLRVIEAATGRERCKVEFGDLVWTVSFSPDGRYLAAGSFDNTARVIEAATGMEISRAKFDEQVHSVSFDPGGRLFAAGSIDRTLRVIEAATGREVSRMEFGSAVNSVTFSRDGLHVAAGSFDNTARVIEAATGREISRAKFDGQVKAVSFSPDGRYLAAGSEDKTMRVIEAATGREVSRAKFDAEVNEVSFSLDGRYLAVASNDKTARVIDFNWIHRVDIATAPVWASVLRLQSGCQFQADGRLHIVPGSVLKKDQETVLEFVAQDPGSEELWQHATLKWGRMLPEERTTSPWSDDSIRRSVGRWLIAAQTDSCTIRDCANRAPWHPLEPVSLARLEVKPEFPFGNAPDEQQKIAALKHPTTTFLSKLTLKRLREADEQLYGRGILAEYAAWAAKVMHDELHLDAEALEALTFALERTPQHKQSPLLELQKAVRLAQ